MPITDTYAKIAQVLAVETVLALSAHLSAKVNTPVQSKISAIYGSHFRSGYTNTKLA
jgi:hypothetical protein